MYRWGEEMDFAVGHLRSAGIPWGSAEGPGLCRRRGGGQSADDVRDEERECLSVGGGGEMFTYGSRE